MGPRKHIHISKVSSGWSFGFGFTHDSSLNETYLWVNFFKWMICIGKLAYLKQLDEEEDEEIDYYYDEYTGKYKTAK